MKEQRQGEIDITYLQLGCFRWPPLKVSQAFEGKGTINFIPALWPDIGKSVVYLLLIPNNLEGNTFYG